MPRFRKLQNVFVLLGAVSLLTTMTACSPSVIDRAEILGEEIKNVCNLELDKRGSDLSIQNFELIGADVNKSSFDFDVSFNGVSSFTDKSRGYTSLTYEVPSTYFEEMDKNASYQELYDIFENIISKYEPVNVEVSPVQNVSSINNAFVQNEVSPFEKYHVSSGLLYNLGNPVFDDEQNRITFDTKTLVELKSRTVQVGYGLGIGFNGRPGLGVGVFISPKQGTFTLQDTYSFVVDDKTYESMKKDPSLVYTYCAEAIQNKQAEKIEAIRKSTTMVTYDNADLLDKTNINDLENELSK